MKEIVICKHQHTANTQIRLQNKIFVRIVRKAENLRILQANKEDSEWINTFSNPVAPIVWACEMCLLVHQHGDKHGYSWW